MKLNQLITVLLLFALPFSLCGQHRSPKKLVLGVNGHPLNQKAYLNSTVSEQLMLVKSINCKYYRIDVQTDSNGNVLNHTRFLELTHFAKSQDISIVPMLYLTGFSFSLSKDAAYKMGLKLGVGFGEKYGRYVDYYELGNEMDVHKELARNSGSNYSDYQSPQINVLASFLQGLNYGLKKSDSTAQTIVNCGGWFHFVYLELLKKLGVNYDIAGYHWYSYMDDYSKTVDIDILKILPQRLQMPIWFTEVNYVTPGKSGAAFERSRKDWVMKFIDNCSRASGIQGLFIYELLDEPDLSTSELTERTFGVFYENKNLRSLTVKVPQQKKSPKFVPKALGKALQSLKTFP